MGSTDLRAVTQRPMSPLHLLLAPRRPQVFQQLQKGVTPKVDDVVLFRVGLEGVGEGSTEEAVDQVRPCASRHYLVGDVVQLGTDVPEHPRQAE